MKNLLSWKELLVIAGLKFVDCEFSGRLELRDTKENISFIRKVIKDVIGKEVSIKEVFNHEVPNLNAWMCSLSKHGGRCSEEIFIPNNILLNEIDVVMLGVIRQLNNMKISTMYSCSGHSIRRPRIGFTNQNDARNAKEIFKKLGVNTTFINNTNLELNLKEEELIELGLELYHLRNETEKVIEKIKKQRKLNRLEDLLMISGKSGSEQEIRKFVYSKIESLVDIIQIDEYGNLLAQKKYGDGNTVLLSAHLDVVGSDINPNSIIMNENGVWKRDCGILGADDRAGVAIIINLLNEITRNEFRGTIKIAFTVEEEIGRFGAENIDKSFFEDVDYAISLDRRNSSDIITHSSSQRYCTEEFGMLLQNLSKMKYGMNGYKCVRGGISDLTVWSSMGIESVNLSIGYYKEHTFDEYLVIDEWLKTEEFSKFILRKLGNKDIVNCKAMNIY